MSSTIETKDETAAVAASRTVRRVRRTRITLLSGFVAVAVVLAAAGTLFLVRAHSLSAAPALRNDAGIDEARTSQAISQVSTALNQVLSYDYRKPSQAQAAAQKWLVKDAPAQYATLFKQLQQVSNGQQLTMIAKVSKAGVVSLRGNTAQLLVFLDQQSTRASDQKSSVSAAQVQVTAVHSSAGWRISELLPI